MIVLSAFSTEFSMKQGCWGGEAGGEEGICTYQEEGMEREKYREDARLETLLEAAVCRRPSVRELRSTHTQKQSLKSLLCYAEEFQNCAQGDGASDGFKQGGDMMRFVVGNSGLVIAQDGEVRGKMGDRNLSWQISWSKTMEVKGWFERWSEGGKVWVK